MGIRDRVTRTVQDRKVDPFLGDAQLVVERRAKNGGDKMREVRSAFVELEVTHNTVIGEIFCDARLGYSKMFRQAWLDGIRASATGAAAKEASDGDAEGLAWFNVVVGGKVGIAKEEHAGADGSAVGFAKR